MSEKSDGKTLLLVDGSSYLYRAYHALPDLRGPGGEPTGALRGVVSMLRLLREQYPTELGACVFDAKGKTFRDDWYPDYKANRSAMPDDLALQIDPILEAVALLGWPVLSVPGIEADDAIGTLCKAAVAAGFRVVVSTGDKDLAQLVNEHVTLVNTMSNERLDPPGVMAKFGVPPDRIVDYLTLVGDAVDNVPGVAKVGPKTAAKWINEYGALDGVIAAASTMKGAAGENLRQALPWLPTARKLVTVATDCDLSGHVADWPAFTALAFATPDPARLLAFYDLHDFKAFRRELEVASAGTGAAVPPPPSRAPSVDKQYETVVTRDRLDAWIARLEAAPLVALDTFTDALDPMRARLVGLAFADAVGQAAYVPLRHGYAGVAEQLPVDEVLGALKPWLQSPHGPKLGHNIKYHTHALANEGIAVQGYLHDTMLQSYVLEAHKPHPLESLAERHLGRKVPAYEDLCGKGAQQIPFAQLDLERAAAYACELSESTLHVHEHLWPQIESNPALLLVYRDIEMPSSVLLGRIERTGVRVDGPLLAAQSQQLAERMLALEQEAFELAGQPFNLGSPKQIGDVLFGKLGLPVKKKTASGAPSTDEDVLAELAADYPLPARLLEHRSLSKLKGTYTDKLPLMVNPATGRVHTNYAQAVAVTGRLSSNDPNLQNIPIRTKEGRRVREAFVPPAGHSILSADYSQIELRIMAHMSEDPGLLRAFDDGVDVHRATASEVFGSALDQVSSEQRRYAKTINFGLIYGMGAFGLAQSLGIERHAAATYIERYFQRFTGVRGYMERTKATARQKGYVETLFGRRIYLPEINGGSGPRKSAAERQAINAPMQGTAADLIKRAMLAVQETIDREQRATRIIMQVHDELVFDVPDAELAWARAEVPAVMARVASLRVPLLAEVGVGKNWDEAH
ncbi:MAG: DNA polymerase I [Pseudomonadota bacterium]|nr:DNA polymerase I [Pseudomonadota bacterium]